MTTVLIHPFSSLLSAYGMGLADIRATRQQAIEEPFGAKALAALNKVGTRLSKDVSAEVAGQGVPAKAITVFVRAHIRYAGTDTALIVKAGSFAARSASPSTGGEGRRAASAASRGGKKSGFAIHPRPCRASADGLPRRPPQGR